MSHRFVRENPKKPVNFEKIFLAVMKKEFCQIRNTNNFIRLVKLAKLNEILNGLYSKNPYFKEWFKHMFWSTTYRNLKLDYVAYNIT